MELHQQHKQVTKSIKLFSACPLEDKVRTCVCFNNNDIFYYIKETTVSGAKNVFEI